MPDLRHLDHISGKDRLEMYGLELQSWDRINERARAEHNRIASAHVGRPRMPPEEIAELIGKGPGDEVARSMIVFTAARRVFNLRLAPYFRAPPAPRPLPALPSPEPAMPDPAAATFATRLRSPGLRLSPRSAMIYGCGGWAMSGLLLTLDGSPYPVAIGLFSAAAGLLAIAAINRFWPKPISG